MRVSAYDSPRDEKQAEKYWDGGRNDRRLHGGGGGRGARGERGRERRVVAGKQIGRAMRVRGDRGGQLEDLVCDRRQHVRGARTDGDKRGKIGGAIVIGLLHARADGPVRVDCVVNGTVPADMRVHSLAGMVRGRVLVFVRVHEGRGHGGDRQGDDRRG